MPNFDFTNPNDRARFILYLPSRKLRAAWLAKWRAENPAMADRVEAIVRQMWLDKKRNAR